MNGVAIGIAGWSYPDWRGVVYPRGCRDELRYLARYVDFIELNNTFYHVPDAATVAGWHERTHDLDLFFTAKLPGSITHAGILDDAVVDEFRAALEPLRTAGRLRALLAQFSAHFEFREKSAMLLRRIAEGFGDFAPLALEVRHGSWIEPGRARVAESLGFSIAHLDYAPGERSFYGSGTTPREFGYFRIHGRNAAWFRKQAERDEVYDYEYSSSERAGLGEKIRELAAVEQSAQTLVVTNNHFQGKAVKLALELAADVRGEKVDVPDPLLAAYPELGEIARGGLF